MASMIKRPDYGTTTARRRGVFCFPPSQRKQDHSKLRALCASAEEWDILQNVMMTPEARQAAAAKLKRRVYGKNPPDVREAHGRK